MRVFVFKPDGIGDFVLATGAIRLLARECGEENLTLCVKTILVPLARDQFPRAEIFALPTAAERKVLNLFVWNFLACLPLWGKLRRRRFDAAVCFRSMRNYLETFLFYSAAALGVSPMTVNQIVNGKRSVTAKVALRLGRYFGMSPQFWLNLQARHDLEKAEDAIGTRLRQEVKPMVVAC